VFVVWSLPAESDGTARDVQLRRARRAQAVPAQDSPLNAAAESCLQLHREAVAFALKSTATNDTSFASGNSAARAMHRSLPSAKSAIFTIDKRRAGSLSSEKIFVAVLRAFVDARDGSEDCFTHSAAMGCAGDLES
jgi:hypothetical protein